MYIDFSKILSHNMFYNMLVGERGVGKTYGFKDWAINSFLKTGMQFMYIRRYKSEFEDIGTFFDDQEKYQNHEFRIEAGKFYIDKKVAGFYVPLSKTIQKKSTVYNKVNKIMFDEFVIGKDFKRVYHYLPNEVESYFMNMISTVVRSRTDKIRIFLAGNADDIMCPYFAYFNLYPSNRIIDKNYMRNAMLYNSDNAEFQEHMANTEFGKSVEGTTFAKKAIHNKFDIEESFVEKKQGNCAPYCCIKYNGLYFTFWVSYAHGRIYVTEQLVETVPCYVLTVGENEVNTLLLSSKRAEPLKFIAKQVELNNIRYETYRIKNIMLDVFKYII